MKKKSNSNEPARLDWDKMKTRNVDDESLYSHPKGSQKRQKADVVGNKKVAVKKNG